MPISVTTAIVTLLGGFLADRVPVRYLLSVGLFANAAALVTALYLPTPAWAYFYGFLLGCSTGFMSVANNVMWANYYGRQHLGSITGFIYTVTVFGAALGPMPFGVAHDYFGNYVLAFSISALIPLFFAIGNLFALPPEIDAER